MRPIEAGRFNIPSPGTHNRASTYAAGVSYEIHYPSHHAYGSSHGSDTGAGSTTGCRTAARRNISIMIGTGRITAVSDGSVPINLHQLLRGTTPEQIDAHLARNYLSNPLEASINAFLIESGSRRILVDTGAGAIFGPGLAGQGPVERSLR